MINYAEKNGALFFDVRALPRASKNEIVGELNGALKIRIAAPPVEGAANAEIVQLLAKIFGVAKSEVEILSGQTSKIKRVKINNGEIKALQKILSARNG